MEGAPEVQPHPVELLLRKRLGSALTASSKAGSDEFTVEVQPGSLLTVLELLRDFSDCPFRLLLDITAVDRFPVEPRFSVVYHLLSLETRDRIRVKAWVPGDDPTVPSAVSLWPGADMLEREVFDLFGIRFAGHPNLSRILMPEDWQGHPLRKDYAVEGPR